MNLSLAHIAIVVDDYDRAIDYYTRTLGFELTEDTTLSETKRWVLVTPPGSACSLLLARAANDEQQTRIGNQTGGRVFLFLHTADFDTYYTQLQANEVEIVRSASQEPHGKVAVFRDLYGNLWDLIQPNGK
ncbi:MAG: VOC family protein [Flavobacteriales bacterium]|jgi:catechol 2,3-dioxygenase-like lactoylglutathione lyase family enzyme